MTSERRAGGEAHALWGFSVRTDLPSDQAHNANPQGA